MTAPFENRRPIDAMLEMARVSRMPSPFWRHSGTEASVSSQPRVSYRSPCRVTSGVVALDLTSVPMLVSDTVTNGFEFSVTRERFRPAGTSADRDCSRSSPASRCRTSHGPAGSISEAHGLLMSRIPPRAPFPNGIARGRRCRLRSKFAADSLLEGDGFELPVPREKKSRNLGIPSEFN